MHHVLVVDDEPVSRQMLQFWLRRGGYTVTAVASATDALAAVGSADYDLIFLDLILPVMDGLELGRRIRLTAATPIIMLSGASDDVERARAFQAGIDDYIDKPFDPDNLLARAAAAIEMGNARNIQHEP